MNKCALCEEQDTPYLVCNKCVEAFFAPLYAYKSPWTKSAETTTLPLLGNKEFYESLFGLNND